MRVKKEKLKRLVDSRILKVLSCKKQDLEDSIVLVSFDSDKNKTTDTDKLLKLVKEIDKLVPSGAYFPVFGDIDFVIYDRNDIKNKNLIVSLFYNKIPTNTKEIEETVKKALVDARNIEFCHLPVRMTIEEK